MYAWIEGILERSEPAQVVINTHGIGYVLAIPLRLFADLPPLGSKLRLYTSFLVRENSQALYGFVTDEERKCFEMLLHVTGVGPKLALSILSHLKPEELYATLHCQDMPTLCAIPGIGKKSAERLFLEMKDRCPAASFTLSAKQTSRSKKGAAILDPIACDARDALIHLGYSAAQAEQAVSTVMAGAENNSMPLATLITKALKAV